MPKVVQLNRFSQNKQRRVHAASVPPAHVLLQQVRDLRMTQLRAQQQEIDALYILRNVYGLEGEI